MNYVAVTLDYIVWWYSGGLKSLFLWLAAIYGWAANFFSIKTILPTLFSPWKKVVGERKPGLDGLRDWMIDNLVSRFVGFMMRIIIIIAYLLFSLGFLVFGVVAAVFWVGFPLMLVFSLVRIFI